MSSHRHHLALLTKPLSVLAFLLYALHRVDLGRSTRSGIYYLVDLGRSSRTGIQKLAQICLLWNRECYSLCNVMLKPTTEKESSFPLSCQYRYPPSRIPIFIRNVHDSNPIRSQLLYLCYTLNKHF